MATGRLGLMCAEARHQPWTAVTPAALIPAAQVLVSYIATRFAAAAGHCSARLALHCIAVLTLCATSSSMCQQAMP